MMIKSTLKPRLRTGTSFPPHSTGQIKIKDSSDVRDGEIKSS